MPHLPSSSGLPIRMPTLTIRHVTALGLAGLAPASYRLIDGSSTLELQPLTSLSHSTKHDVHPYGLWERLESNQRYDVTLDRTIPSTCAPKLPRPTDKGYSCCIYTFPTHKPVGRLLCQPMRARRTVSPVNASDLQAKYTTGYVSCQAVCLHVVEQALDGKPK
jgi:hypothetical protein